MLKRNRLIVFAIVIAMLAAFAATGAKASECIVKWGTGATEYFTISTVLDSRGKFPRETTCLVAGVYVPCTEWLYEIKADGGQIKNAAKWYQAIDSYGFTPTGIFESIVVWPQGGGTNNKKIPCFGDNTHLSVIEYKSTDNGDPAKFGITVSDNQNLAVGRSSLVFLFNSIGSINCVTSDGVIGLPGPVAYFEEERIIRNVSKTISFDVEGGNPVDVLVEINETECTFTASDPDTGVPYPKFPITEMKITSPGSDTPGNILENWAGKCEEISFVKKVNPCTADYCLGGWCVKIPVPCQ